MLAVTLIALIQDKYLYEYYDILHRIPFISKLWKEEKAMKEYLNDKNNEDNKNKLMKILMADKELNNSISAFSDKTDAETIEKNMTSHLMADILRMLGKITKTNSEELKSIARDFLMYKKTNKLNESGTVESLLGNNVRREIK
jgi:hypothetical protein